jgi:hypothetical protein
MMKLQIQINGKTLVALVDMGSTHNFIKEAVVPLLGLSMTPWPGLAVKVANDEWVVSQGVYREADMVISYEHFSTNLYILPLDGFDIVLGV